MEEHNSKILALIPAYNEHVHIGKVVSSALKYLPVLVIDDGSSDNTFDIASQCGAIALRQIPNQGKGAALERGFRYALENGYEAVITLDGDGQHDPEEIPNFIQAFNQTRSDLIIGKRDFRKMPFVRRCTNTIGTWMFSSAMMQQIPDNQSGYRLISAPLMKAVVDSKLHGFEYEVEMIMRCVLEKLTMSAIPIKTIYADEKSHIKPLKHGWRFILLTIRTGRVMRKHMRESRNS